MNYSLLELNRVREELWGFSSRPSQPRSEPHRRLHKKTPPEYFHEVFYEALFLCHIDPPGVLRHGVSHHGIEPCKRSSSKPIL